MIDTSDKSHYINYSKLCLDSNSYSAPAYWLAETHFYQFSHSIAKLDWGSSRVPIPLINGSGSKFEDNSTVLFNRVTVKKCK